MGEWDRTREKARRSFKWNGPLRGAWDLFFEALKGASFMSLGSSKTGNDTFVRIRLNGRRKQLKIGTYLLTGSKREEAVVVTLLKEAMAFPFGDLIRKLEVPGENLWELTFGDALGPLILAEARARGVVVLDRILDEVAAGNVGARQDAYRLDSAMAEFRKAVGEALERGASFDDMKSVLEEESVRQVMEA